MKTTIFCSWKALSACALLAASCLSAQSPPMVANIPFDFAVKNEHMAAGTYEVTVNRQNSTVLIRGGENGSATFALTSATLTPNTQTQAKLVFNRYGNRYFLHQVWKAGSDQGRELTPSKAEREYARNIGKPEVATLLVSAEGVSQPAH